VVSALPELLDLHQLIPPRCPVSGVLPFRRGQMRHLIIAAHPSPKSFNHAVVETYRAALTERGHHVECRDLYAANFNPVMSVRDLTAIDRGKTAKDIRDEQAAIRRTDVLTLVSPLWWSGFPAMLKGYLDRVFCAGFAYVIKQGEYVPGLADKQGVIITTSGATREELKSSGRLRAFKIIFDEGLMEFCGIDLVQHLYLGGIDPGMSQADGEARLASVRRLVKRNF
jgi:NAD(P)H dehydrogenase (quinone)